MVKSRKTAGLSQAHKKYLEIIKFSQTRLPWPGMLYDQGITFYQIFRMAFDKGYQTIFGHEIFNMEILRACLVNFHFSIEMLLKSLIFLPKPNKPQLDRTHNLVKLVKTAEEMYPDLSKISGNSDYMLLLQELSTGFNTIRYAEGCVCVSHNKKEGCELKRPLQELSENMHSIFETLVSIYKKEAKLAQGTDDTN